MQLNLNFCSKKDLYVSLDLQVLNDHFEYFFPLLEVDYSIMVAIFSLSFFLPHCMLWFCMLYGLRASRIVFFHKRSSPWTSFFIFCFLVWNVCWISINFQSSKCCEFECGVYTLCVTYYYMFKRKGKHWWHTKLWSMHLKITNNHGNWVLYKAFIENKKNPQAFAWLVGH